MEIMIDCFQIPKDQRSLGRSQWWEFTNSSKWDLFRKFLFSARLSWSRKTWLQTVFSWVWVGFECRERERIRHRPIIIDFLLTSTHIHRNHSYRSGKWGRIPVWSSFVCERSRVSTLQSFLPESPKSERNCFYSGKWLWENRPPFSCSRVCFRWPNFWSFSFRTFRFPRWVLGW